MILMKKAIELQFKMLFVLLMMVAGVVEMWGGTTTYHIINLGRLDDGGRLTDTRTEALKFTITSTTSTLQVPDQYKSPLAKNWKYYSANQVNFNTTTKECTFKVSEPTLVEGQTLSSNSDIYVTYEIDENAFSTLNLYDGGICLIKQGNNYLIPGHWKNDPNTSFASSTTVPTSNQYYWQFNIADPYQITIQSKSTTMVGDKKNISVLNWFLSKSDSFNDIRLKNSLSEAKNFKVWAFALLNGSENKYRLVVADGYSETANDTDGNGHGYLGQPADKKSRYSQYYKDINNDKIKEYVNIDLDIIPVTYNYTFNIVDNEGNVAIKSSPVAQYVGKKLSSYTDIPEAIRSPYLKDETITFYTFSGNYSSTQIIDDNKISTIPLAENANIYVRYTNNHLDEKFLHLAGSRILNFKLNNEYVYDNSGTLALENNEANTGNTSHLWNVMGRDPYAVKIRNVGNITHFFQFATPSTLSLGDGTGNSRFILMAGKDPKNDGQVELMAATGGTDQYRIGITDNNLTISTAAAGTESLQVELLEKKAMVKMRIIDKSGKIIVSEDNYETSRLAVPDQWMCPLVSEYHYWSTATQTGDVYTTSNPIVNVTDVGSGGTIYVTYDVGNTIDLTGSKTYLLRFHDGEEFYQEDGSDGVMETKRKAYYPYNNGDFNLYVYGQERWHQQLADGANQRTRWLWRIVSNQDGTDLTGEQVDPYHVIIKSRQNQEIKLNDVKYEGSTYLRTYKPTGHGQVVTGTAYKNTATNPAYPNAVPTDQPTEYMILGKSINELKLVTVQEIEDGTTTERRTVNSFEMYWKNNPTARDILNDVNKGVGTHEEVDYELSPEQKAVLTGKGWHTYQCWAYSAPWDNQSTGGKTLKNGNHWFQTISMGEGEFNFEEVELAPVLILLDKHGWEVVRILLPSGPDDLNRQVRYDAIHKYNSPMVKAYHYYKTADKVDGYHKYNVNLDSYATDTNGDEYTSDELGVLKDGKGNLPDYETQALDAKNNERDWYVTYDVKDEYVNTFPGASSESVLPNASYLLKVGTQFLKTENGNTISTFAESTEENDKEQWFLKPNFNIDREMGYKYQGEAGAQDGAMTKAQMDSIYNKVAYTNALYYAQVLGLRGYMYSQLAKFYTPVQESEKFLADSLGNFDCIPLYLEDNMDAVQPLSTAAVVYNQAFSDLEMSIKLFEEFGASYTRSSKLELDREVVCGILAYAYLNECVYRAGTPLYADHVQKALANAEKVINSNKYQTLKENQLLTTGFNSVTDPGWIWAQEVTIETSGGLKSWFGQVDIHSYSYAWAGDTKVIDATLRDMIPAWDKRRKWFNDGKANSIYNDCPDGKFFSAQNPTSTDADDIDRDWLSDNVFMRIESMYLVAAEANWRLGDLTQAASYITAITDERLDTTAFLWEDEYNDFKTGLATDSKLKDAIVYNWRIEMWGEGYGLDTFRRFGESRKRGGNHDYANFSLPGSEITYNPYLGDKKTN